MNDFERQLLNVMQNSSYIAAVARNNQTIMAIDYFGYNAGPNNNASFSAVAGGAGASALIPIQADSDFVLTYMSGNVVTNATGAIIPLPNATLQITDTGTGKTFFNQPTLFGLVTGGAGFPFLLPSPRVISPNVNVKLDVVNNTGANADFWISLIGARIYYQSAPASS